jgi:hypothetical protein
MLHVRSWLRAKFNGLINAQTKSRRPVPRRQKSIWERLEESGRSASQIAEMKEHLEAKGLLLKD